jgi:protein PhnA
MILVGRSRWVENDCKRNSMTDESIVKDSNGNQLKDGDSVTLIKDLKVKGTSETIKRGSLVKNIRLTGRPGEIECNTKQVKGLVLKTEFLKKA